MARHEALARFFEGQDAAATLFESIHHVIDATGPSTMRITKSQIAFSRRRAFAWVWTPGRYLRAGSSAPVVLSLALPRRDSSPRWKEVVEPSHGRWMHHLEIHGADDVDDEVRNWLFEAWSLAA